MEPPKSPPEGILCENPGEYFCDDLVNQFRKRYTSWADVPPTPVLTSKYTNLEHAINFLKALILLRKGIDQSLVELIPLQYYSHRSSAFSRFVAPNTQDTPRHRQKVKLLLQLPDRTLSAVSVFVSLKDIKECKLEVFSHLVDVAPALLASFEERAQTIMTAATKREG